MRGFQTPFLESQDGPWGSGSRLVLSRCCPFLRETHNRESRLWEPNAPQTDFPAKETRENGTARGSAWVCGGSASYRWKVGGTSCIPHAWDFSGQHATAMPNLKTNTGMTFLKIFIQVYTEHIQFFQRKINRISVANRHILFYLHKWLFLKHLVGCGLSYSAALMLK